MSSLPFSRLICAKRRSRSPRFDTSPCTPVTFLPISLAAVANSGSRRPVMKTSAPSFTNCCAVAIPMPLLPPVMRAIFPSSLAMYSSRSLVLEEFRLAPRLGHCHDLQQVAVRVLEVETAPAPAGVDLAVGVAVWATAVGDPLGRHPGEDRLELRLADMERVVMALARPVGEARPAPQFWLVRKIKGQALVHLHLREVARARLDRQAEDLGEELGGGDLVFRWHDGMVQANR